MYSIYEDNKYNFNHKCNTEPGSSGSPILNMNNKLIGIHKEGLYDNLNKGIFVDYPIKEFIHLNYYNKYNYKDKLNDILKDFYDVIEYKRVLSNSEGKLKQSKSKIKNNDISEKKFINRI